MNICPECHHPAEGIEPSFFANQLRLLLHRRERPPTCSSHRINGVGDAIMCGCEHPRHSENVVPTIYASRIAETEDND